MKLHHPHPRAAWAGALYATLLPLVLPTSALSQSTPSAQYAQLDPTVVTATRIAQPVSTLLSDVRIIDATDIANAGRQTLVELLQSQGGVEVSANGGPGQVSGVFIRGTNTNHVVVLVDGVRINSATSGTNAFENIPLNQIERIEIVRGAASSLYGADAIGGVIQIFTRHGGNRTEATAGGGTWSTQRYTTALAREFGAARLHLSAGYEDTQAFSATNARSAFSFNADRDPYRNRNLSGNVIYALAPGHELTLRGLVSEGVAHFDAGPDSDEASRQRLSTVALESRNAFSSDWTSTLRIARSTDDIETTGGFPGAFRTDQDQASWQNDVSAPGGKIAAGVEFRRERIASTTDFSEHTRSIRSAFASYSGRFGAHLLQASARHDDNSQFGGRTTGTFAYGYRFSPALRASASLGSAFKAPSFNDLYYVSPYFAGNPDLKPERALNREAALNYDNGAQRAGLTVYQNRIRDLIAVDPTFSTVVNVNQARIRGATLAVGATTGATRLRAEATREEAIDETTGTHLVRRARAFGALGIDHVRGALRAGAEVVASGARFDSVANTDASRMAGYALLNLRASYAFTPTWTAAVRWNNVLERKYELGQGYNTPGSNAFVWLSYSAP